MRLYDRVMAGDWGIPELAMQGIFRDPGVLGRYREMVDEGLSVATRIDISNVAEYWHSDASSSEFDWLTDFPNLAPPFEAFWMEYQIPQNERIIAEQAEARAMGALSTTHVGSLILGHESEDGWCLECFMFVQGSDNMVWGGMRTVLILVDKAGEIKEPPKVAVSARISEEYMPMFVDLVDISAMALAISLMHCKNVALEDAPDTRTRQQRRYDDRKGTKPVEFKTLVIDPMKQVLKTEGGADQHGIRRALHTCRGHFKTYTAEKPRFGRDVGMFYVRPHLRGSADVGMVGKDYKVKAPRE